MRYLVLTPLRGMKPDPDGTVSAERLGADAASLVSIGAVQLIDDEGGALSIEQDAPAVDDAEWADRLLAHFEGREDPARLILDLLRPALIARGWLEAPPVLDSDVGSEERQETGEGSPPAETPPAETPPAETPPAETPPAETPPAETPPAALFEVSERMKRDELVAIAKKEGAAFEGDANKAAIVHAIICKREGRHA